ncbi:MAG: type III toxin-antitoxin system ToxN/AbiQ family toxin [Lachnospiraceae bacterium]|nr:type III toxin-antitoxin system ToxN/AbiQ family toxin [Lachnospiraceae bacterium]
MHSLINEQKTGADFSAPVNDFKEKSFMFRLKIYEVKTEYIDFLSQYQEHLFLDKNNANKRKYIGIILDINGHKYFAPLSSFKEKHKKIKESVDFIKIKDYAVININNMIPVPSGQYYLIDINSEKDSHYKYLLQAESREINRQKNRILKNAQIVYSHKKKYGISTLLAKRTNNFDILETACDMFDR